MLDDLSPVFVSRIDYDRSTTVDTSHTQPTSTGTDKEKEAKQRQLIADLLGGPAGLQRWKYRTTAEKKVAEYLRKVDFSCVDFVDVSFFSGALCDFQGSSF